MKGTRNWSRVLGTKNWYILISNVYLLVPNSLKSVKRMRFRQCAISSFRTLPSLNRLTDLHDYYVKMYIGMLTCCCALNPGFEFREMITKQITLKAYWIRAGLLWGNTINQNRASSCKRWHQLATLGTTFVKIVKRLRPGSVESILLLLNAAQPPPPGQFPIFLLYVSVLIVLHYFDPQIPILKLCSQEEPTAWLK